MAELDVKLQPVLKRFPPGDRWTPVGATTYIFFTYRRYRVGISTNKRN